MRVNILKNIIIFAFVLFLALPSYAQQEFIEVDKIEPVPDYGVELSEEAFLEESELYEDTPLDDRFLAYQIRLPKKWHKTESQSLVVQKEATKPSLSQRVLGPVAKYYGPGRIEAPTKFEIEAQGLDYDVTAKNWFMQETLIRGYALEGLTVHSDNRIEALYVVVEKDTAYVVRSVAQINGTRMVVASYYVPDKFWMKERAEQQRAIQSFRFLSPEKSKIETTRSYSFLDLLTFNYPSSWRLIAPNIYSIEGMEAKLLYSIDDSTINGEMHISILSTEFENALMEEITFLAEELNNRGLKVGDLIETRDGYEFGDHVFYGYVEAYEAVDESKTILGHEYWLAVMEEDRYYYVVTMLTPGRLSDFYTWARNTEAFATVIETFRPPPSPGR